MSVEHDGADVARGIEEAGEDIVTEQSDVSEQPSSGGDQLNDQLGELRAAVSALAEQVRAHHARAEARERVIDNLHAEVERLRAGERSQLLRPVIIDLQHLRGDLLHQARTLPAEITRRQAAELLDSFALSVELALERCGSVPVRPSVGQPFSAREHRAIGLLPAERSEQDNTVGAVFADGYRDTTTDRVTVPAKVQVLRWTPPGESNGTPTQPRQSDSGTQRENGDD